jgi:hypothetical protein
LSEVVHLWEYKDLDERAQIRKDLAQDKEWKKEYLDKMMPMLINQNNLILKQFNWYPQTAPVASPNYYELRIYTLLPGMIPKCKFTRVHAAYNDAV